MFFGDAPVEVVVLFCGSYLEVLWLCAVEYLLRIVSHVVGNVLCGGEISSYIGAAVAEALPRGGEHRLVVGGADGGHWSRVELRLYVHEVLKHSEHPSKVVAVPGIQGVALLDVEVKMAYRHCRQGVVVLIVGEKLHNTEIPVEVIADAFVDAQLLVRLVTHLAVEKRLVERQEGVFNARKGISRLNVPDYVYGVACACNVRIISELLPVWELYSSEHHGYVANEVKVVAQCGVGCLVADGHKHVYRSLPVVSLYNLSCLFHFVVGIEVFAGEVVEGYVGVDAFLLECLFHNTLYINELVTFDVFGEHHEHMMFAGVSRRV